MEKCPFFLDKIPILIFVNVPNFSTKNVNNFPINANRGVEKIRYLSPKGIIFKPSQFYIYYLKKSYAPLTFENTLITRVLSIFANKLKTNNE
jgi:hypothetical protein